jgi:hypothetical protein
MNTISEHKDFLADTFPRVWAAVEFNMRQYNDNINLLKRERIAMLRQVGLHIVDEVHYKIDTSYEFNT